MGRMKSEEVKEKKEEFFRMRVVEGKSFDSIARLLGVSKNTLLKWAREYKDEIWNLEQEEKERLLEQYRAWKNLRLESLLKLREKVLHELERRELKDIPYHRLVEMYLDIERVLNRNLDLIYKMDDDGLDDVLSVLDRVKASLVCDNSLKLDED